MSQKVRAAVLESLSHIEIREFDMPEIGQDDGLLKRGSYSSADP